LLSSLIAIRPPLESQRSMRLRKRPLCAPSPPLWCPPFPLRKTPGPPSTVSATRRFGSFRHRAHFADQLNSYQFKVERLDVPAVALAKAGTSRRSCNATRSIACWGQRAPRSIVRWGQRAPPFVLLPTSEFRPYCMDPVTPQAAFVARFVSPSAHRTSTEREPGGACHRFDPMGSASTR
jgi:hypothetical protein